ncbi:hypothetical protein ACFL6M_04025, partial [Candidatus Eisenbacteria bacterium]
MSIRRPLALSAFCVFFLFITGHIAHAVPAKDDAVRTLTQPDGSTFSARLYGDEWFHRYETAEGYTVLQDSGGYWVYAERGADGALEPSDRMAGRDDPFSALHLRPANSWLSNALSSKPALRARSSDRSGITGTQQVVIILVEFSDTPGSEGSAGLHDADYFANATTGIVFGSDQGKLSDYLDEVSYGQLDLQGVVANGAWHAADSTEVYYGEDCGGGG